MMVDLDKTSCSVFKDDLFVRKRQRRSSHNKSFDALVRMTASRTNLTTIKRGTDLLFRINYSLAHLGVGLYL